MENTMSLIPHVDVSFEDCTRYHLKNCVIKTKSIISRHLLITLMHTVLSFPNNKYPNDFKDVEFFKWKMMFKYYFTVF